VTPAVFAIVLLAAFLHALWNAMVKGSLDRTLALGLIALGHVVPGVALAMVVPAPLAAAWPYIVVSTVIHWGYYYYLNAAYRVGDLSFVYPVARGLAPVMIALGALVLEDEYLPVLAWVGIAIVSLGILSLALSLLGWRHLPKHSPAFVPAVLTAILIAAYSIIDGLGIRQSGSPLGYIAWLFSAEICVAVFVLYPRAATLRTNGMPVLWIGLIGGLVSGLAYALVLYAKTLAPLGIIAAVRETSVIIAALIGVLVFGERPAKTRILSAIIVALGVAVIAYTQ